MGLLNNIKDKIENLDANDYEQFYAKSLCDRVFSLPMAIDEKYKNVALSGRIYELPTQFLMNATNHFFSDNSISQNVETSASPTNELIVNHLALTKLLDLTVGLLLSVYWNRAASHKVKALTEYELTLEPILYQFKKHHTAPPYESNRYNNEPYFIYYRQHAFFYEAPGNFKFQKRQINLGAKFDTKIRFGEKIQGTPLGEIGFSDNYILGSPEYDFL